VSTSATGNSGGTLVATLRRLVSFRVGHAAPSYRSDLPRPSASRPTSAATPPEAAGPPRGRLLLPPPLPLRAQPVVVRWRRWRGARPDGTAGGPGPRGGGRPPSRCPSSSRRSRPSQMSPAPPAARSAGALYQPAVSHPTTNRAAKAAPTGCRARASIAVRDWPSTEADDGRLSFLAIVRCRSSSSYCSARVCRWNSVHSENPTPLPNGATEGQPESAPCRPAWPGTRPASASALAPAARSAARGE
jgi:hypothetical protein